MKRIMFGQAAHSWWYWGPLITLALGKHPRDPCDILITNV